MAKLKIHKFVQDKNITTYYFTKSKNKCLMIDYDKSEDYGQNSSSGTRIARLIIHYQNSFKTDDLIEIVISEVPKCIQDILEYFNNDKQTSLKKMKK